MMTVTLKAVDLLSKYGFDDGAILDEILRDRGYDTSARPLGDQDSLAPGFGQAVLGECVRTHLAPGLSGFEISYDASLGHNPVRLASFRREDEEVLHGYFSKVKADLTSEQVLSVAAALAPGFPHAQPDEVFGLDM